MRPARSISSPHSAASAPSCCRRSYAGRLMYFPDGFPILVSNTGIPRFTFFDEGQVDSHSLRALPQTVPASVCGARRSSSWSSSPTQRATPPARKLPSIAFCLRTGCVASPPMTPHGCRSLHRVSRGPASSREAEGAALLAPAISKFCARERACTPRSNTRRSTRHGELGSTSAEKIRQRFLQTSMRVEFSTVVLPYRYPIDILRPESQSEEGGETPYSAPRTRPLTARISHDRPTSYADRWGQGEVCAWGGSDPGAPHLPRRLRRAGRSHPTHTTYQPWTGSGTGLSPRQYRAGSRLSRFAPSRYPFRA